MTGDLVERLRKYSNPNGGKLYRGLMDEALAALAVQEATIAELRERNARFEAALHWYGWNARLCRLIHSEGDVGRNALAADGGERARRLLTPPPQEAPDTAAQGGAP
jgi:hypothetical protein